MKYSYHDDARGLAFNVKFHSRLDSPETATDAQRERAGEVVRMRWWHDADALAKQHGFTECFSAGRSGGWCYPVNNGRRAVTTEDMENDSDMSARFLAFGEGLAELMKQVPAMFADELQDIMQDDAQQAAQDAHVAAIPARLADALRKNVKSVVYALQVLQAPERCAMRQDLETARAVLADFDALGN